MAFSPPVVGCLVIKGLLKGGVTGTPGPPWLRLCNVNDLHRSAKIINIKIIIILIIIVSTHTSGEISLMQMYYYCYCNDNNYQPQKITSQSKRYIIILVTKFFFFSFFQ